MDWQLEDAQSQFCALVKAAEKDGPQIITVHGKEKVVVLSAKAYQRLRRRDKSLLEFFQTSPWAKVDIDLSRSYEQS
jgi:prevent-host-death family protein